MIFLAINIPAADFQIRTGRIENVGLKIKQQAFPVDQVYIDGSTPYSERLWRSVVFWNPSIKTDYFNLNPEILPDNKIAASGRVLLITDKPLDNLTSFEDEFHGNRIYLIGTQ